MRRGSIISILFILLIAVSAHATQLPNCAGDATIDTNIEDGIEVPDGICAELNVNIGTISGNIEVGDGASLTIVGDISIITGKIDVKSGGTLIIYGAINSISDEIEVNTGSTLKVYGDINSVSNGVDINEGEMFIYGNIDNISSGIDIDGTLEIYSNVTVDGGFRVKPDSRMTLNGGNVIVTSGDGKIDNSTSQLETLNGSSIDIQAGTVDNNGDNSSIFSDNSGNTISVSDPWEGDQGDFSCSGGDCSDSATNAQVIITESDGNTVTTESGTSDTFTVELSTALTLGIVRVDFSSVDMGEGTVSPSFVTFSLGNMGAKTITVNPVNDFTNDGPQFFTITTSTSTPVASTPDYDGVPTPDVGVINVDDGGINSIPVVTGSTVTTNEDSVSPIFESDLGYSDGDSDPLTKIRISTLPSQGILFLDSSPFEGTYDAGEEVSVSQEINTTDLSSGYFLFIATANENGTNYTSFNLKANDGKSYSSDGTITFNINPVNDAPSFTKGADESINEDAAAQTVSGWATAISTGPADESGQIVSFNVSNDNNPLFSAQPVIDANGELTYTPAADANGVATVTVSISDDGGTANGGVDTSADQTFTITVNAVNDDPTLTNISSLVTFENTTINGISFTVDEGGDVDEDSQTLTVTAVSDNQTVIPDANITVNYTDNGASSADVLSPTIDIIPASNQLGSATITVTVQDDGTGNLTSIKTFLVVVEAASIRGPGGVADQLSYWFIADKGVTTTGSLVDSWVDQSSNELTATSSGTDRPTLTATNASINNRASLSFDGDDFVSFAHSSDGTDDMSFGTVVSTATPSSEFDVIILESTRNTLGYRGAGVSNPNVFYDRVGGSSGFATTPFANGTWLIHQKTFDNSGTKSFYFNGSVAPETDTYTTESVTSTTSYIGSNAGSNGYNGELSEVYKFRRVINHAEKTVIANYLSAKYNLTLSASNFYAGDDGANGDYDFDVIGVGNSTTGAVPGSHTTSIGFDGLALTSIAGFEDDDYVFGGHDGTTNGFNTTDLGGLSGGSRWERIWYIDKTDASTALSVDLTFDFSDAGLSQVPTYASNYNLIYRSGQSGNWTEVTSASSVSGDEVIFSGISLTNGDGYYTIGQSQSYSVSTMTASTDESGTTAQFDVVLGAQPTTDVVITVTSGNTAEGTVDKSSLTFTNANWNSPQTVTITGVDDNIIDGDITYNVTLSVDDANSDDEFDHLDDQTVAVTNIDDDAAGYTLSKITSAITEGGNDTFTIVLDAQPASDVVIDLSSDDTGAATVSPASLTFTNGNWNSAQTVTISSVQDDDLADETPTITATINDASSDNDFDPLADQTVAVTLTDDDVAGYTLSKTTSAITEGGNDTFTIVLDAQPASNVVIDLSSDDTGAATVSPASLTFTNGNWNSAQTVTIAAVQDDDLADETPTITATINDASSDNDFDPLANQTVAVTLTDDDAAGYTLSKTTSAITEGGNDTFTIVLDAQPASNVVIDLSSDDTGAATVSPASLTFTNGNWNSAQTVTISSVQDDDLADETPTITATINDASSDNDFDPLADQTVAVTLTDDDVAGYTLSKTTSAITEGGNDTFTIVLDAQPASNVVIDLSSDDTGAATVSPASLTFTNANWNSAQTVTISSVQDDDLADETPTITATINDASSDNDFDPLADQTVAVTLTDDDVAGYTLSKTTSAITEGGNDTFTIVLDAQPASNVVIDLSSDDTGAATVSPASLTFTNGNWNSAQTVTISSVQDDDLADETPTITATINDASSDNDFDPLADQTVAVTLTDDDVAGYTLSKTTSAITEGGNDTFTIVLDAQPASNVVIDLSSDDTGAATVSPASLTFTNGNWNSAQTVTISSVQDDDLADETPTITATINDASSDNDFDPLADKTVAVTLTDDDAAGYTLSKITSAITEGGNDTFTIVLDAQPASNVVIDLSSDDTGAATVSPASLTFTNGNWNSAQTVTISSVQDDDLADETPTITATINDASSDNDFDPLADQTVAVTLTDDDAAGYTLSKTTSAITEGGNDTFTIVLDAQPASNVVIDLSSDDTGAATVSPASLTFTNGNWNSAQTVTIASVQDDDLADETPTITATINDASSDNDFDPLADKTVAVTLTDDDAAGYTLSKITSAITEGGNDTFTIVLDAQPASNVVIDLGSDDTGAATVSPASLTFTNGNWNSAQTVTIASVQDDDLADETPTITATINDASSDNDFDPLADQTVAVTLTDDDAAGYTLSKTTSAITEGGNDTFTIVLDAQPASNVVIDLSSDDTGAATVSPASLTFTNGNWNSAQTVTIAAVQDDDLADETPTITATINDASSDNDFDPLADKTVAVTLTDDDAAGYTLSKITSAITEGGNDTFTIVLDAQPASNVVIDLSSDDTGAATVSPASLTFTNGNWNSAQTVTIAAVQDDDLADETPTITATINDASSDNDFDPLADQTVAVTLTDDDAAGYTLSKTTSAITEGGNDTFTIVLDAQPASNVVIDLSSDDTGAATVSPASLTFTNGNWNSAQTVTIAAVQDDDLADETPTITATINDASSDNDFDPLADKTVAVTLTDDDAAGYTLSKITSAITEGGNDTFTIVLDAQPASNVVIDLSSDDTDAATVSPASLTFTNGNWNSAQTVTIAAVQDDDLADETPTITATINDASSDNDFDPLADKTVAVTLTDDDAAGYTLSKITSAITEGGNDTFTIVLDAQPASNVVIDLSSDDTDAATVSPASLTFTNGNWNSAQTVTISSVQDDDLADETPTITATINDASSDNDFDPLADQTVAVTLTDDDAAGYTLSKTTSAITEGGNDTFTIVLDAQPASNVVIDLSSDDTGAATVSPSSLTFTSGNWNSTELVTITSVQDDDLQDETPTITASVNASSDGDFTGLANLNVTVTVTDDDIASISISAISGNTREDGTTATFTIVLDSEPTADVTIGLSSDNTAEGTVSPASVTFTTANWNVAQTVTVTGVDDAIDDGDVVYTIVTAAATSSDANYNGLNPADVSITNEDNDGVGISVSAISGNTREDGTTATFTIVLDSEPTADVTIGLSSDNTAEGTVSPASVSFTTANWNVAQTVTVTGVDDAIDDGDVVYTIVTAAATSSDTNYNGLDPADVSVTNEDDDSIDGTPVISGQVSINSIDEDTHFTISLTNLIVTDSDNDYPADHTLILMTGYAYDISGSSVIPQADYNGALRVNIKVSDGVNESNVYEYEVDIQPVNDKPILVADALTVQLGNTLEGNLLTNDSDVENDDLVLTDISPLPDGLIFNTDGSFIYSGDTEIGTIEMDYVVCDDGDPSECAQSAFTLIIEGGDFDGDGIPDSYEIQFDDVDDDGVPEYRDLDSDNDGINDSQEAGADPVNPVDTDQDGTPDFLDMDSDGDGKLDSEEGVEDCDRDGILNYIDNDDPCKMKIADAFSPNGDGKNDEWIIQGIESYPGNKVTIFNRWGNKIFEIDGYDNNSRVWRGEINTNIGSDKNAPYSTYYFIIDLKDGSKPIAGNILISR